MKRTISLLLCVLLTLGSFPVHAFASETEPSAEPMATEMPAEETVSETTAPTEVSPTPTEAEPEPTEEPVVPTESETEPTEETIVTAETVTEPTVETVAPIEETVESQFSEEAMEADTIANGTCGENLTWTLDSEGVLTISGTGAMSNYGDLGNGQPWDYLDVSAIVLEEGVTGIGSFCFWYLDAISITIPSTLTFIRADAFGGCGGKLTDVYISDFEAWSNINFEGSGKYSRGTPFYYASNLYLNGDLVTEYTFPEGTTTIGNMLYGVKSLTKVTIPDGVTKIDNSAFANCTGLTNIELPVTVSQIGAMAFSGCSGLNSMVLPKNVKSIGDDAFSGCSSLTSFEIPEGITSIGMDTFSACTNLTSITIPKSVTSIAQYAFWGSNNLTDVYYGGSQATWANVRNHTGSDNGSLTSATVHFAEANEPCGDDLLWEYDEANHILTIHGTGPMYNYTEQSRPPWNSLIYLDVKQIIVEEGVTTIGDYAFEGAWTPKKVSLPESLISIGEYAFQCCFDLTDISIPDSVTKIGGYAFNACGFKKITIPSKLQEIGPYAFYSCDALTEVVIPDTLTFLGEGMFSYCSALPAINIPEGITAIPDGFCSDCGNLTTVTIPSTVVTIGSDAFIRCSKLSSIDIPEGASEIAYSAFASCTNLKSVALPSTLQTIGPSAFSYCTQLTDIVIPDGVTSIGSSAFWSCSNLSNVSIPSSVASIGASAFSYCEKLTYLLIPEGVTKIEGSAFDHCTTLRTVALPNTLKTIGTYAFNECTALTNVNLPTGLQTLGSGAFWGCTALESVMIPETVTSMGSAVFDMCTGLKSAVVSAKVKELPLGLFEGCKNLTTITLPKTLSSIKDDAFKSCDDLQYVYFGGTKAQWDTMISEHLGTGNEALTDSKVELRCVEYSPEIALLEYYADQWYQKYIAYGEAVKEALNDAVVETVSSRSELIRESAKRMQKHDQEAREKYIVFTYSIGNLGFCPKEYQDECYQALAEAMYDNLVEDIDFSKVDFSDYTDGGIIQIVRNSIANINQTYSYEDVSVMLNIARFGNSMNGKLSCQIKSTGKAPYEAMLNSPQEIYLEEMTNLCEALSELGIASVDNGYTALAEDLLGTALAQMNEQYLTERIKPLNAGALGTVEEEFIKYGTGKFIGAVKGCNKYFTTLVNPIQKGDSANLIKEVHLYGVAGVDFESYYNLDGSELEGLKVDKRVKDALRDLEKASDKLEDTTKKYLNGELSVSNSELKWKTFFNCPVNVAVYDSTGVQIGYVGDDDIWHNDNIVIEENAGAKMIASLTEDILSFRITATDFGTMSCSFEEYDEGSAPIGRLNFYDISLAPQQNFKVMLQEDLQNNQNVIQVQTDGTDYNSSEYIPATEDATVVISGVAAADDGTSGGAISGEGTFTRGDAAVLLAMPESGYRFQGWYQENVMMSLSPVYEFTAREDVTLTAKFRKEDDLSVYVMAEGGGSAIGNGHYANGEIAQVLAVAQSGCEFIGWYLNDTLVSNAESYSFAVTEHVVLVAKFTDPIAHTAGNVWLSDNSNHWHKCTICGEVLDLLPHTEDTIPARAATCTAAGLTEGKKCSVCGKVTVAQKTIPAKPHTYDDNVDGTCNNCGVNRETVEIRQVTHMLRMYNPYTGEHFYTGSEVEKDNLVAAGWQYEGVGFTFPGNTGAPVHRLYDPVTGEHLYTMDEEEKATLEATGWNYEGIAFNSAYDTEAVQHRLHNPYATVGAYHFTFSEEEKSNLIAAGWEYQGIGWYSCYK